ARLRSLPIRWPQSWRGVSMSATDELGSQREFVRNAQLRENCNVENPLRCACRLAALAAIGAILLSPVSRGSADDNCATPLATKLGVTLEKSFDSTGPDAWDPKRHPLVFVTTEGPGYGAFSAA